MEPADSHALDAYSQIVIGVAERLTPRVAAVRVRQERGRGEGAGSAVVLTDDGHLLTNAHVVEGAASGQASFADGTVAAIEVIGRDPLSDLAVIRADRAVPDRRSTATPTSCGSARSWSRWATRSAWPEASRPGS